MDLEANLRLENQRLLNSIKELKSVVSGLENELVRNKQKLGDLLNSVMEHGGPIFADKVCSGYM